MGAGLRYDGDETEIAGAIRKSPIEVVKCITSDIYVPATAEFVIEGEILPDYREKEGPLGEFKMCIRDRGKRLTSSCLTRLRA